MREKIAESGLRDEMTQKIKDWQNRFSAALKTSADEERVCNTYIDLLQKLLCDPITHAPLDAHAVIGNDGRTYGQMSLAVYLYSVPEMYRNRSPLDITNPDPFMIAPHPVVRHMMKWLKGHDALLYSEKLEGAYLQLLPKQQPMNVKARMNCIMERQKALDCIEAERKSNQSQEFDKKLAGRMQAWRLELEKLSSFKSRADNDLALLKKHDQHEIHAAQERLGAIAAKDQEEYKIADEELDRIADQGQLEWEDVKQQLDRSEKQERISIARLKAKIIDHVEKGLTPLIERIDAYANETLVKIQAITLKEQQDLLMLDYSIKKLEGEIVELQRRNQALEEAIDSTSRQIIVSKQEEVVLQRGIYDTKAAIQEIKERNKDNLFSTIAIIGASIFATWAIQAALHSTSIGAAILPERGGATLRLKLIL
jgi:hypothetical protein